MIAKPEQSLRVVSLNLNGLRSAYSKGVIDWMQNSQADIICLQETRIQHQQWLDEHKPAGWHTHLFAAERAGYAGTAIYSRLPWLNVSEGLGFELADTEGRFTVAEFAKPDGSTFKVASIYIPSGSASELAQQRKDEFMAKFEPLLKQWVADGQSFIICGDVNIAHKEIDIKNWKGNLKNSGFLPHERAWLDHVFGDFGYNDAFRVVNKNAEEYSWWSNRGQAYAKNVGWRIDYQMVTADWARNVLNAFVYKEIKFSDHAPVVIDYKL